MATAQAVGTQTEAAAIRQEVSSSWWILLVQGIASIILGILLFVNPVSTLIAIAWVLGIFWLVGGVVDIVGAFTGKDRNRHWIWELLAGALSIVAGLILLYNPIFGAVAIPFTLALFVGIGAVLGGIFKIVHAVRMRKEINGEIWMIIWGIIMVILGGWILLNMGAATLAYVFVMAIMLVVGGVFAIYGSFRLRSLTNS